MLFPSSRCAQRRSPSSIATSPVVRGMLLNVFSLFFARFEHQQPSLRCGTEVFSKLSFDPPIKLSLSTKLTHAPLESIIGNNDICYQVMNKIAPQTKLFFSAYQQLITTCLNCTRCELTLSNIHAYFQKSLKDLKASLIVIIPSSINRGQISNIEGEKKVRFAFIGNELPQALDDCQIIDGSDDDALRSFSKTSVLFVSISFIILMVISLAWLVFYYIQRFRYAHAKDRLQRRLFNAAKKALTRIPTRQIRCDDNAIDSDCPVCIDSYRIGDLIRCLPCRHIFHKTCVDPWLLEHRTCPMCKSDILKAFGYHISVARRTTLGSQNEESTVHRVHVDTHSMGSQLMYPALGQDPFDFTPSPPPQITRQVVQNSDAQTFSIMPTTVYSMPIPSKDSVSDLKRTLMVNTLKPCPFVTSSTSTPAFPQLSTTNSPSNDQQVFRSVNGVDARSLSFNGLAAKTERTVPAFLSNPIGSQLTSVLVRSFSDDEFHDEFISGLTEVQVNRERKFKTNPDNQALTTLA